MTQPNTPNTPKQQLPAKKNQPANKSTTLPNMNVPGTPEWWLARLVNRLMIRQQHYAKLRDYAEGRHPLPTGDARYVRALQEVQRKSRTNYINLVIQAVTERMRVRAFRFGPDGKADPDAKRIWFANNGALLSSICIKDAAIFGHCYALVSPPDPERVKEIGSLPQPKAQQSPKLGPPGPKQQAPASGKFGQPQQDNTPPDQKLPPNSQGDTQTAAQQSTIKPGTEPIIVSEDPRCCITEEDPVRPFESLAGLRYWQDNVEQCIFAVLYLPDATYVYRGPQANNENMDYPDYNQIPNRLNSSAQAAGFELVSQTKNVLGKVPLIRGVWKPNTNGMAECEEGAFDIQDRINWMILMRLIITKNQAYRQRFLTGGTPRQGGTKKRKQQTAPPFDPGADMVWWVEDPDAKFGDFEQADITQALEAVRDDVGDLAAVTQTPTTYLTNKMVNVSGDTLAQDQAGLLSKTHDRMESMGWFFEAVMKACFLYVGDKTKAYDVEAETMWEDPEIRTMAEMADMVAKWTAAGIPLQLVMEKSGKFSPDEIAWAVQEAERVKAQDQVVQMQQMQMNHEQNMQAIKAGGAVKSQGSKPPTPSSSRSSGSSK